MPPGVLVVWSLENADLLVNPYVQGVNKFKIVQMNHIMIVSV